MITDPIADMLTRMRNGYLARKSRVAVPFSGFKKELGQVLVREGFLKEVHREERDLVLKLKYLQGRPVVQGVKRVSKPGRRIYRKAKEIKVVRSGLGQLIISSQQGLLTGQEARGKQLGGEVLCEIW